MESSPLYLQLSPLDPMLLHKAVLSNPVTGAELVKVTAVPVELRGQRQFQIARFTKTQVFHENLAPEALWERLAALFDGQFRQCDLFAADRDRSFRLTKRGQFSATDRPASRGAAVPTAHNRVKRSLLPEGQAAPALVDLGVLTREGKIAADMYDKYRQINRFLELVNDVLPAAPDRPLQVVDFGCGKSYLTFVLYHFLTVVKGFETDMTGLDLKADVVAFCNTVAEKYGYDRLRFAVGDIAQYAEPGALDLMVSLHACDTATDAALHAAIERRCAVILSVPCCQHELTGQIHTDTLDALTSYGILQERFSALATDAIRACLLEACGYRTQVLEFIELEHSPKNLLLRAVRGGVSPQKRAAARQKAERLMQEFGFRPTLYTLLRDELG